MHTEWRRDVALRKVTGLGAEAAGGLISARLSFRELEALRGLPSPAVAV